MTTPTPRRLVVDWDEPDDDEATRWRVVIKRGVDDGGDRPDPEHAGRLPGAEGGRWAEPHGRGLRDQRSWCESTVASGTRARRTTIEWEVWEPAEPAGEPSLAFDVQGTRHAQVPGIVTAGTSTTDGTHDAAHRYVIQLAHSATDRREPSGRSEASARQRSKATQR